MKCALGLVLMALPAAGSASAGGQGASLELSAPAELPVGTHAVLSIVLRLPEGAAEPVLITPSAEGEAVGLSRGRLMRGDARVEAGALRFELPITANASGSSIVRVHALAYACRADRCRAIETEAQAHLLVLPN